MSQPSDDPLARAFVAVDQLHAPDLDPVAAAAWQEAWDALHEVLAERDAFVAVVNRGQELIDALDQYEVATDSRNMRRIAELAQAAESAEDAFVEALNRAPLYPEAEDQISGEAAHLAALDRFDDGSPEGDDDEPRP